MFGLRQFVACDVCTTHFTSLKFTISVRKHTPVLYDSLGWIKATICLLPRDPHVHRKLHLHEDNECILDGHWQYRIKTFASDMFFL